MRNFYTRAYNTYTTMQFDTRIDGGCSDTTVGKLPVPRPAQRMRDAEPFPNSEDPVIDSERANHGRNNRQPYRTKLMVDEGLSRLFFIILLHSDSLLCVPRHMSRHHRVFHRAPCSGNACVPYHTTRHRLKHVLLLVGKPKRFRSNPNFSLITNENQKDGSSTRIHREL